MLFRDRVALGVSPLFIRLALAVTFIWAGAGKLFFKDMQVQGEQAAILANMGVNIEPTGIPTTPPQETQDDAEQPAEQPADEQTTTEEPAEGEQTTNEEPPAETTEADPAPPVEPPAEEPPAEEPAEETGEETGEQTEPPVATLVRQQTAAPGAFTAEQFPTATPVRRVYGVALMLHDATGAAGGPKLLPDALAAGNRPKYLAWIAGLTEFFGGCFIALGFFTRLWALGVFGTMVMAMWLTQIGPVVGGGAPGTLGFLPAINDFQVEAWRTFLWQLVLGCAALSLFFSGPGPVAFDVLFGPRRGASKPKRSGDQPSA